MNTYQTLKLIVDRYDEFLPLSLLTDIRHAMLPVELDDDPPRQAIRRVNRLMRRAVTAHVMPNVSASRPARRQQSC